MSDKDSPWYSMHEIMDYVAKNGVDPLSDPRLRRPPADRQAFAKVKQAVSERERVRKDRIQLTKDEMLSFIEQDQGQGGSGSKARVALLAHCSVSTLKRRWASGAPGEPWPTDRSGSEGK